MRATRNCMNFKRLTSTSAKSNHFNQSWTPTRERCDERSTPKFTFSRSYSRRDKALSPIVGGQPLIDSGSLVTIPKGVTFSIARHMNAMNTLKCWCLLKSQKVGPCLTDCWLYQSWRITNSWCFQKPKPSKTSIFHPFQLNNNTRPRKPRVVAMRRLLPHTMLSLMDSPDFGETYSSSQWVIWVDSYGRLQVHKRWIWILIFSTYKNQENKSNNWTAGQSWY